MSNDNSDGFMNWTFVDWPSPFNRTDTGQPWGPPQTRYIPSAFVFFVSEAVYVPRNNWSAWHYLSPWNYELEGFPTNGFSSVTSPGPPYVTQIVTVEDLVFQKLADEGVTGTYRSLAFSGDSDPAPSTIGPPFFFGLLDEEINYKLYDIIVFLANDIKVGITNY